MKLRTLGHATLLLQDAGGRPLLATDPWLLGSCYWRSWWLEHNPTSDDRELVGACPHIYLTHDHPDHFHTPTLRRLGKNATYLTPQFLHDRMGEHLQEMGLRTRQAPSKQWMSVGDGVRLMSVPAFGDDSILIVDTPVAVIVNLNDARPTPPQLAFLVRVVSGCRSGKRVVAVSSYSSAGLAFSIFRDGERLPIVDRKRFAQYPRILSRVVKADDFMPCASQVVFARPDTEWANAFKVRHADLAEQWPATGTRLLPPHSELDLETGEYRATPAEAYRTRSAYAARRVSEQLAREADYHLTDADRGALLAKLRGAGRPIVGACFPRGIVFRTEHESLRYSALSNQLTAAAGPASAAVSLPGLPLAEALRNGFFSDLCIPMFTRVDLDRLTHPATVWAFFMAALLHDVGATRDTAAFLRWLRQSSHDHLAWS